MCNPQLVDDDLHTLDSIVNIHFEDMIQFNYLNVGCFPLTKGRNRRHTMVWTTFDSTLSFTLIFPHAQPKLNINIDS